MRLANRTREVEFFKKMLLGNITKRILLIQAVSGMGKTSLLGEFGSICDVYAETAILVKIDLKSAQNGIAYIFSRLQRRLGEENFKRFNGALRDFLIAGVEVSGNQIEGTENQIQVVLSAESEDLRNMRLNKLQESFFRDLQEIKKPIVMIFDTFNLASSTLADWIGGGFLAEVAEVKNIRVVIAGQSVPNPTIEWEDLAEKHFLNEITDIDAWHLFAQAKGFPYGKGDLQAFVKLLNGHPKTIFDALESEASTWKQYE